VAKEKTAPPPILGLTTGTPRAWARERGGGAGQQGRAGRAGRWGLSANNLAGRRSFQPLRINTKSYLSTEG